MAQSTAYKHDSPRRATYQDVLDAPAHRVAEIVDGTLYNPPATGRSPCPCELIARCKDRRSLRLRRRWSGWVVDH